MVERRQAECGEDNPCDDSAHSEELVAPPGRAPPVVITGDVQGQRGAEIPRSPHSLVPLCSASRQPSPQSPGPRPPPPEVPKAAPPNPLHSSHHVAGNGLRRKGAGRRKHGPIFRSQGAGKVSTRRSLCDVAPPEHPLDPPLQPPHIIHVLTLRSLSDPAARCRACLPEQRMGQQPLQGACCRVDVETGHWPEPFGVMINVMWGGERRWHRRTWTWTGAVAMASCHLRGGQLRRQGRAPVSVGFKRSRSVLSRFSRSRRHLAAGLLST